MQLIESLNKRLEIEKRIFENEGELTPLLESELDASITEIAENLDRSIFAYKIRENDLSYAKILLKDYIESKTKQLETFKELLFNVAKKHGKLEAPLTSLSITKRNTESVLIFNFDLVMQNYPSAVVVEVMDNVKTIRIRKEDLKKIWLETQGKVKGFEVMEREVSYPNIRLRARGGSGEK